MGIYGKIRDLAGRIIYPNTYSSEAYVKYLRKRGCHIGKQTHFFSPPTTIVDVTRPRLIRIGDYCKITAGVVILSHDDSLFLLRMKYKEMIGSIGKTTIGNNVFIGINAIITKGTTIGNNVIVGTGSVVTKDIPDDVVCAGNPAKVIMTLDELYQKRKKLYVNEAKEYARLIYAETGKRPTVKDLDKFYSIFLNRDLDEIKKYNLTIKLYGDDYEDAVSSFLKSKPIYQGFEEFLKDCGIE